MERLIPYSVVRFCSIECTLQISGESSVRWMIDAWLYAIDHSDKIPTVDDILALGSLIEPYENIHGFRRCGVQIGLDVKMDWENIPRQMVNLMENVSSLNPTEAFKEFETIHPFRDGNGRTGVLLYNWLSGTLKDLEWAPNLWNDSRRTIGYGA